MATFPTIYRRGTEIHNPVVGKFKYKRAHDPAIRSLSSGGYVTSRAKFTRKSRVWPLEYTWVKKTNKNIIEAFEDTVNVGSDSFTWLNPENATNYTVRFLDFVDYDGVEDTNWLFWNIRFILEQV